MINFQRHVISIIGCSLLSVAAGAQPEGLKAVDLGLTSGTLWASCNVGGESPEDYGDYYAWGETESKEVYGWDTYFDTENGGHDFLKYDAKPGRKKLIQGDDVATAVWGTKWCMPTGAQWKELYEECRWTWTSDYNGSMVSGYVVSSKASGNKNSIFFPAGGHRNGIGLIFICSCGLYWSSELNPSYPGRAQSVVMRESFVSRNTSSMRYFGLSVRPVVRTK